MDERTFERLVESVSREVDQEKGTARPAYDAVRSGFYLMDNWRVRSAERDEFLEFYVGHVTDVIKEIDGFQDARVLVAPVESSYSWHVQAIYEFESDEVMSRFRSSFDRIANRRHRGMDMDSVLDHMREWVLAHEDGTLIEVHR